MASSIFKGVITAVATPFTQDGECVDGASLARLVKAQLDAGVHGIVACGATGEACALSESETEDVVRCCLETIAGKIPCFLGIFSNSTRHAQELVKRYSRYEIAGFLVVVPYFNKPTQGGIVAHFSELRAVTDLPIIVYNHPGRTSVNMLPATAAQLAETRTIAAIKEGAGDMVQAMDMLKAVNGRIPILAGEDALFLSMLACGSPGIVSASANVMAQDFVELYNAWTAGHKEKAASIQLGALAKIRTLFKETNPIPVKTLLAMQGLIDSAALRLPLTAATPATVDELRKFWPTT
ncbi:MAG: 4-hydroxy-tetrahydrodipicolinate synthase [Oligoflexia bacterium]|nr:4-hydroxy-tetrahydrodipicolinate synthase [Oligoflexia bacterium]